MGRNFWKGQYDNWNKSISRKDYRNEKKFVNRETRLRNATSFFISNLPDYCSRDSLWQAFEHLDNLEDAFVPAKKDRAGNKFSFIKLSNVQDSDWWIDKLKEVRIDGAVIGVNLAKFNRDGSKVDVQNNRNRISVFDRLKGGTYIAKPATGPLEPGNFGHGMKSYSSAVNPDAKENESSIELPPLNTETKKAFELKSLIGEAKDIESLNSMKENLSGITENGLNLKYLGGLKMLLCFDSPEEAEDFRCNKVNDWEKWFSRLYLWEGTPPPLFERIAWVKVLGVPISLWDRHVINKIGERCGRLIVKSEADPSDGNMAEDRLAILVNSGKRIALEFSITWKGQAIPVWVEEISGKWNPDFLTEGSAVWGSSEMFSDVDGSVSGGCTGPKIFHENGSLPCMGNQKSCTSPVSEVGGSAVRGVPFVQEDLFNEETDFVQNVAPFVGSDVEEEVGPGGPLLGKEAQIDNLGPDDPLYVQVAHSGGLLENGRPSFITTRKKKDGRKHKKQGIPIPDLNNEAENTSNSDPFNISEILRMEAQIGEDRYGEPEGRANCVNTGDNWEDDLNRTLLSEVNRTMEFGVCLGIGVEGFENHVKKLVSGEMEFANRQ
ncbi:putative RNA recognition motif domain, nucleotide-binding alpha-beta plait domain superfamily [Helianthus annuus]|nr:putative RNA recognition motif domain, nucleotide-binding alpha-beta plait domain superfamily [Helianthus annuus]